MKQAFFRGDSLTLDNPRYMRTVAAIIGTLAAEDRDPRDLTVEALGLAKQPAEATIVAREAGVVAGLEEACWLYSEAGLEVRRLAEDGDAIDAGGELVELKGDAGTLLSVERVGLNVLQRMCGIATATKRLQALSKAYVVATRKTPWGLLDNRAVSLGGGGTHRLGLGDAILIKNNHLALLHEDEVEAVRRALAAAWENRTGAAFIEVEVRSAAGAHAATETFRALQETSSDSPPCLLLLDNMSPSSIATLVQELRAPHVLLEASGNINEATIAEYSASGVDAISVGALTHSVHALDLHQRISL